MRPHVSSLLVLSDLSQGAIYTPILRMPEEAVNDSQPSRRAKAMEVVRSSKKCKLHQRVKMVI